MCKELLLLQMESGSKFQVLIVLGKKLYLNVSKLEGMLLYLKFVDILVGLLTYTTGLIYDGKGMAISLETIFLNVATLAQSLLSCSDGHSRLWRRAVTLSVLS